jgi:hypothetical protein
MWGTRMGDVDEQSRKSELLRFFASLRMTGKSKQRQKRGQRQSKKGKAEAKATAGPVRRRSGQALRLRGCAASLWAALFRMAR